jgi:hypothetical protein
MKNGLISLLSQKTDKEYNVILTIPYLYAMNNNEEYKIPSELLEFAKNNPRLIINRDTPDYGPIIKIYGALKYANNLDDIIIACDDDHIYHEKMLEYHIKKLNEHKNTVICFRGDMAVDKRTWIEKGIKKFVYRPDDILFPVNRDCYLMIPGHWHSVGYWRKFFKEDFNEELFALGDGDDPLIGYYMKKRQIPILCVVWDEQTDFRPIIDVSGYLPCHHFPIIEPLGYPENAGGWLIRNKSKDSGHGRLSLVIQTYLQNYSKIYVEEKIKEDFIDYLKPQHIFMKKTRFGPKDDGGYVMPEIVLSNCSALFTYGIGHDSRFEEEFGSKYKKPVYMFDHTIRELDGNIENRENQKHYWEREEARWLDCNCHFYQQGLGFKENCKDFNQHYEELKICGYVFLKIDIEGGEYKYFLTADINKFGDRVMGILLEVHWINDDNNRKNLVKILSKLEDNFVLCHVHGNNWGDTWEYEGEILPVTLELSFINRKFLERYEPDERDYPIPDLDLPNAPHKPDLSLGFLKKN